MTVFTKVAVAAAIAFTPMLAIAAPDQTQQVQPPAASSAAIPDSTMKKAGAALHDVAQVQEKYQPQMQAASPDQRKGLSQKATAEAVQAIQSHGISLQDYSNVIHTAQNDPQVKQRLLELAKQQ